MAVYYVSTTGSDSHTCLQAQNLATPKLTVQAGINCMVSGDRLEIRAGTYALPTSNPPAGVSWAAATAIAHYGSEVVTIAGWPAMNTSNQAYFIFDGIIFNRSGNEVVYIDNGAHHIRFTNCEITGGTGTAGLALYGAGGNHQVLNSRIHHNGVNAQFDHGIYIKSAANLIEHNELDNNAAAGLHFYNGGTDMGSGNVATRNRIHHNGTGIIAWDLTSATISNNALYAHTDQGISANRAPSLLIYHNSITSSGGIGVDLSNSTGIVVRNNIIYGNTVNISDTATGTIKDFNLCNSGCAVNANPLFVSSTNLHLQAGSPAIDAGTTVAAVTVDLDNAVRPYGAAYDIGAYEYGATPPAEEEHPEPGPPATIVDGSVVCCNPKAVKRAEAGGGQSKGAQPIPYAVIGAQIECVGGGVVPTQADLTYSESWSGA